MGDEHRWRSVRRVHPYTIGVWVCITTVAIYLGVFGEDAGNYVFPHDSAARYVGSIAGLSSLLFLIAFITNRWAFLSWALMLSAGVFISRVALYGMSVGIDSFPMWISLGLSITSAGAWLLERARHE